MVKEKEALETGIQAYIYAYPLVMMSQTLRVSTNVATPEGTSGPMGQFAHVREYPTPEFKTVVAPNADTLYSVLWLDVAKEPWIVSMPDMKGRYFMLPLLDGWTTVFGVPGTRTTGTGAQKFAITGPGWTGNTSGGGQGVQVADRYSVVARPHLLHGNPRRLQGWARTSGSDVYEGSTLEKSGYIVIPPQM